MRAWRNRQTRAFKGRMIPIVWVQVPSPAPNTKGSTEWRSLLCLPRPLCGLEPRGCRFLHSKTLVFNHRGNPSVFRRRRNHLPPDGTSKFAVSVMAAEKNAELARGKWRRCRQGVLQACRLCRLSGSSPIAPNRVLFLLLCRHYFSNLGTGKDAEIYCRRAYGVRLP